MPAPVLTMTMRADTSNLVGEVKRAGAAIGDLGTSATAAGGKVDPTEAKFLRLAKSLGVEVTGASAKVVSQLQTLQQHLIKINAPSVDLERVSNKLAEAQIRLRESLKTDAMRAQEKAIDDLRAKMTGATKSVDDFGGKLKPASDQASLFGNSLGTVKTIAAGLGVTFGALAIAQQIRSMAASALDFDAAWTKVTVILRNEPPDVLATFKASILSLPPAFGTASDNAKAFYQILSSGFGEPAAALELLKQSAIAAAGGFTQTEVAAKAGAAVLNAYGLQAKDAKGIFDVMAKTVDLGVISFEQLASELGQIIPIAASNNISFVDLSSAIAALTLQGLPASQAITGLRSTVTSLLEPSKEAKETAGRLGIAWNGAALKALGLEGILKQLSGRTDVTATDMANLTGRIEATNAVMALTTTSGAASLTKAINENATASEGAGASAEALATAQKSLTFQMKEAQNEIINASAAFGAVFAPAIAAGVARMREFGKSVVDNVGTSISFFSDLFDSAQKYGSAILSVGQLTTASLTPQLGLLSGLASGFKETFLTLNSVTTAALTFGAVLAALKLEAVIVGFGGIGAALSAVAAGFATAATGAGLLALAIQAIPLVGLAVALVKVTEHSLDVYEAQGQMRVSTEQANAAMLKLAADSQGKGVPGIADLVRQFSAGSLSASDFQVKLGQLINEFAKLDPGKYFKDSNLKTISNLVESIGGTSTGSLLSAARAASAAVDQIKQRLSSFEAGSKAAAIAQSELSKATTIQNQKWDAYKKVMGEATKVTGEGEKAAKTLGTEIGKLEKQYASVTGKVLLEIAAIQEDIKFMEQHRGSTDAMSTAKEKLGQKTFELIAIQSKHPELLKKIEVALQEVNVPLVGQRSAVELLTVAYERFRDNILAFTKIDFGSVMISNNATFEAAAKRADEAAVSVEKLNKMIEVETPKSLKPAEQSFKEMGRQVSTIVTDLGKGIADALIKWKGFGQSMMDVAKEFGSGIIRTLIETMFKPLEGLLASVAGGIMNLFSGKGFGMTGGGGVGGALNNAAGFGGLFKGLLGGGGVGAGLAFGGAPLAAAGLGGVLPGGIMAGFGGGLAGTAGGTAAAVGGGAGMMGGLTAALAAVPVWGWVALAGAIAAGPIIGKLTQRGRDKVTATGEAEAVSANVWGTVSDVKAGNLSIDEGITAVNAAWASYEAFLRTNLKDQTVIQRSLETQHVTLTEGLAAIEAFRLESYKARLLKTVEEFGQTGALTKEFSDLIVEFGGNLDWFKGKIDDISKLEKLRSGFAGLRDELLKMTPATEDMFAVFLRTGEVTEEMRKAIEETGLTARAQTLLLIKLQDYAKATDDLADFTKGIGSLRDGLDALAPKTLSAYQSFLELNKITPELRDEINRFGLDIKAFEDFSAIKTMRDDFAALRQTILDTGEGAAALKSIFESVGADTSILDSAGEIKGLREQQGEFAKLQKYLGTIAPLPPEMQSDIDRFIESGFLTADLLQKLTDMGADISKFAGFVLAKKDTQEGKFFTEEFEKTRAITDQMRAFAEKFGVTLTGTSEQIAAQLRLAQSSAENAFKSSASALAGEVLKLQNGITNQIKVLQKGLEAALTAVGVKLDAQFETSRLALLDQLTTLDTNLTAAVDITRTSLITALGRLDTNLANTINGLKTDLGTAIGNLTSAINSINIPSEISVNVNTGAFQGGPTPTTPTPETHTFDRTGREDAFYTGTRVPRFAEGTDYVPRTGLAMVHQGEAIIPASQNRGTTGGGGDITLQFMGDIVANKPEEFMDELERYLSTNRDGARVRIQKALKLKQPGSF